MRVLNEKVKTQKHSRHSTVVQGEGHCAFQPMGHAQGSLRLIAKIEGKVWVGDGPPVPGFTLGKNRYYT
jgi:hypothetical protein